MINWEGFRKNINSPTHDKVCGEPILLKAKELSGDECDSRTSCFIVNITFSMACSSKSALLPEILHEISHSFITDISFKSGYRISAFRSLHLYFSFPHYSSFTTSLLFEANFGHFENQLRVRPTNYN
jgi:hypothetical protein